MRKRGAELMSEGTPKRKVGELAPAPYNPRKIEERQEEILGESMEEFGDLSGVVFNRRTGRLIGGHQRVKHLDPDTPVQIIGTWEEPLDTGTVALGFIEDQAGERWIYREVDVGEEREALMNLAANKHGGQWDFPLLGDLMAELEGQGADLHLTGFTEEEMAEILTWEPPTDGSGDGGGGGGLGEPVVHYDIIFDDEDQQAQWYRFLKTLKESYPDLPTIGSRLETYIRDTLPEEDAPDGQV